MGFAVPTVGGIQRLNLLAIVAAAVPLGLAISSAAAIGCVIGGLVIVANLYLLSYAGRLILGAGRIQGGVSAAGAVIAPLKMFFIIGVVYVIIASHWVNVPGFVSGILTQPVAIFIETWRVSRGAGMRVGEPQA